MNFSMKIEDKKEFEGFLSVLILGLFTGFQNQVVNYDIAEKYLFNPYTVKRLALNRISENIIDIIENGCELEDIANVEPEVVHGTIKQLISQTLLSLKNIQLPENKLVSGLEVDTRKEEAGERFANIYEKCPQLRDLQNKVSNRGSLLVIGKEACA